MLLQIEKANYIKNYMLHVNFNDGTEGDIDLKDTIFNDNRKIFKELQEIDNFKNFSIALNTVCWYNNLDLAPEYIKEKIAEQNRIR
jgi:Protein of unknown function (DUF2442)